MKTTIIITIFLISLGFCKKTDLNKQGENRTTNEGEFDIYCGKDLGTLDVKKMYADFEKERAKSM